MTTANRRPVPDVADVVVEPQVVTSSPARKGLAALRIGFGLTFLWAFFDKLFALGFATGAITDDAGTRTGIDFMAKDAAWLNGGSPTEGFLLYGTEGKWMHDFFSSFAGAAWADWLFMLGLLGIGTALTFGFAMRIAAATGALLYMLMWLASLPLENNPVLDTHLLGAVTVIVLALTLSGDTWGVGKRWARTHLVRQNPILR